MLTQVEKLKYQPHGSASGLKPTAALCSLFSLKGISMTLLNTLWNVSIPVLIQYLSFGSDTKTTNNTLLINMTGETCRIICILTCFSTNCLYWNFEISIDTFFPLFKLVRIGIHCNLHGSKLTTATVLQETQKLETQKNLQENLCSILNIRAFTIPIYYRCTVNICDWPCLMSFLMSSSRSSIRLFILVVSCFCLFR